MTRGSLRLPVIKDETEAPRSLSKVIKLNFSPWL